MVDNVRDNEYTIKCSKKVIEYIRKRQQEEQISQDKRLKEDKLSDYEKCARSTLVRTILSMLCSIGLEEAICNSYYDIKKEEKELRRKLSDNEIYGIILLHIHDVSLA